MIISNTTPTTTETAIAQVVSSVSLQFGYNDARKVESFLRILRLDFLKKALGSFLCILEACTYHATGNERVDNFIQPFYYRKKMMVHYDNFMKSNCDLLEKITRPEHRDYINNVLDKLSHDFKETFAASLIDYLESGKECPPDDEVLQAIFSICISHLNNSK